MRLLTAALGTPGLAQAQLRAIQSAADTLGLELRVLNASSEHDFDAAFPNLIRLRARGLVISADSVFLRGMEQLATLTVRHAYPQSISIASSQRPEV